MQMRIVEMMTDFVQKRAQERAERNDLAALGRTHPHLNRIVTTTTVVLSIESVQFTATIGGAHALHLDTDGAHAKPPTNLVHNCLCKQLDSRMIVLAERNVQRLSRLK